MSITQIPPEWIPWLQALGTKVLWLLLVIVLDVLLGMIVALYNGKFSWARVADFLKTYGAKSAAWLACELLSLLPDEILAAAEVKSLIGNGVYVILMISGVASVLGHVQALGILPNMQKIGILPTGSQKS